MHFQYKIASFVAYFSGLFLKYNGFDFEHYNNDNVLIHEMAPFFHATLEKFCFKKNASAIKKYILKLQTYFVVKTEIRAA